MSPSYSRQILDHHLQRYRGFRFCDLATRMERDSATETVLESFVDSDPDAREYLVEVRIGWDQHVEGALRLSVSVTAQLLRRPLLGFVPWVEPDACDYLVFAPGET